MRIGLLVVACAAIIGYSLFSTGTPRLERLGTGEYCIYSTQNITSPLITKRTNTGLSYIYHCKSNAAPKLRALFSHIDGESIKLSARNTGGVLKKLGYMEVSTSTLGSVTTTYAYSARCKTFIYDAGQKINLQVALNGSFLTVGWPVILGSY